MSIKRGNGRSRIRKNTASTKPRIFNYSSGNNERGSRADDNQPAKQTYGLAKKVSKLLNLLIGLVILAGVAYMFLLSPSGQIKVIGEKIYPRYKNAYEQGVNSKLKSSVFYRFKPTFDSKKLAAQIKADFPEVNNVDIVISPFRHRPVIELSLAKPIAKLITTNNTYILDEEGKALFDQKYASDSLNKARLLTINDASGHNIELGKPALTQEQISFIREVIGQTKAKGLSPKSFTLSGGGTALDVRFDNLDFYVKFSFYADKRQSSGAFLALYDQLKRSGALPKEYIDVRIPEKAFVK